MASELKITEALEKYYGKVDVSGLKDEETTRFATQKQARKSIGTGVGQKGEGPIIKLVNDVLIQCLSKGASDIHFESYEDYMRIRLRIDGALVEVARPPVEMRGALISRVKIMSGLNWRIRSIFW